MELQLENRVALVTGAAQGIGAAIAEELAREGCSLALLDHPDNDAIDATAERLAGLSPRVSALRRDVTDFAGAEDAVRQTVGDLGGLDILVCCAGITRDGVSWKMSEADFDAVVGVNLKGVFNYNRAVASRFRERSQGRIVNIASINGLRGKFGQTNYAASKGGVIALSKSMAMTEMARELPQPIVDSALAETVLGRLAEPVDVARVVVFLCSGAARHVTGQVIRVDGGQYM